VSTTLNTEKADLPCRHRRLAYSTTRTRREPSLRIPSQLRGINLGSTLSWAEAPPLEAWPRCYKNSKPGSLCSKTQLHPSANQVVSALRKLTQTSTKGSAIKMSVLQMKRANASLQGKSMTLHVISLFQIRPSKSISWVKLNEFPLSPTLTPLSTISANLCFKMT